MRFIAGLISLFSLPFLLIISFLIAHPQANAQSPLFEDNFDDGNAEGWDVIGTPGWNVKDGRYGIHLDHGLSNTVPSDLIWDPNWKDIIFEVDLLGISGTDKNILVKFVSTSKFIEIHHTGGLIVLEQAGVEGGRIGSTFFPLANGVSYHFKIEINGGHIKVFIDDVPEPILEGDEKAPLTEDWKIGLRAGSGAEVWFDNILVTPVTPLGDPTIGPFELPFHYDGRLENDADEFKTAFWKNLTAAFDHERSINSFRPFTGDTYSRKDCPGRTLGITCYDGHNGTDFSKASDTQVYSVADGEVVYTSEHTGEDCSPGRSGFGCVVIVQHEGGLYTLYAHLKQISVNVEDEVTAETILGHMGNTGCSPCGRHLHLGVMQHITDTVARVKMTRFDWQVLLFQIRPSATHPKKSFCTYLAPNGMRFSFQDPSGWALDSEQDPWSKTQEGGGCGVESNYLWKYDVGDSADSP